MRRRNTDRETRDLERAAAAGDREAAARLFRAKQRAGRPQDVTIGEIAAAIEFTASGTEEVDAFMRGLPEELGGGFWSSRIGDMRPLPAMTHEEIMQTLYGEHLNWYERLVDEDAEERSARSGGRGRRRSPASSFIGDARAEYADEVSRFLVAPRALEPRDFIGYRAVRVNAWAIAEQIRRIMREREATPAPVELPWDVEVEGGVLERDDHWEIRFRDDDGNSGSVWNVGDEDWDRMAAHFGATRETIRVACPEGCENERVRYGAEACRRCGPSPVLARLLRAELANEADAELETTTLGSALDSLRQGYDPGHGDSMHAVEAELLGAIDGFGENSEVLEVWDEDVIRNRARR